MELIVSAVVAGLSAPRNRMGYLARLWMEHGGGRVVAGRADDGIDRAAINKAADDERRRRRNLRGRELIGIANPNNGLGGIQNILGG